MYFAKIRGTQKGGANTTRRLSKKSPKRERKESEGAGIILKSVLGDKGGWEKQECES